jgi:SNF2 family DNA or RNA helicase
MMQRDKLEIGGLPPIEYKQVSSPMTAGELARYKRLVRKLYELVGRVQEQEKNKHRRKPRNQRQRSPSRSRSRSRHHEAAEVYPGSVSQATAEPSGNNRRELSAAEKRRTFLLIVMYVNKLRQLCNHGRLLRGAQSTRHFALAESDDSDGASSDRRPPHSVVQLCPRCGSELQDVPVDNGRDSDSLDTDGDDDGAAAAINHPKPTQQQICLPCLEQEIAAAESADAIDVIMSSCSACGDSKHGSPADPLCPVRVPDDCRVDFGGVGYSSKWLAVITTLAQVRTSNPDAKIVIFSQWTSSFNLLEPALRANGWTSLRFTGEQTLLERDQVLRDFGAPDGPRILLASLHAGGVGVDMVMANTVFMLDSWWNEPTEQQAIDRVHRMGQTRCVTVYRFSIEWSIEEWVAAIKRGKEDQARWIYGEWLASFKRPQRMAVTFCQADLAGMSDYLRQSYYEQHIPIKNPNNNWQQQRANYFKVI